ncbi:MAG: GNAT family N-acetyltransferase [Anaerolineales bacterium]|nr:GNAT family N-acetyltransferase [Anaerolineales bacterium]
MQIEIRKVTAAEKEAWLQMRKGVWPEADDDYLLYDMDEILASEIDLIFMAFINDQPAGMIETSVREYAEGCESSPVGYIEAWFVYGDFRRTGVAGVLVQAAENWAREKGCTEMGSDTWLDNEASIRAHQKLGYHEVDRLVHFMKQL